MKNGKFDLVTFFKRALFITVVLAITEAAVIFFLMADKKNGAAHPDRLEAFKPATQTHIQGLSATASITADSGNLPDTAPAAVDNKAIIIKPTSSAKPQPVALDPEPAIPAIKPAEKPAVVPAENPQPKKAVAPVTKTLTSAKMQFIFNSINSTKKRLGLRNNCVQIQKTSTSNVSNAFAIAKYLMAKKFIISGRLTVPGKQTGIRITPNDGGCITVTIGTL